MGLQIGKGPNPERTRRVCPISHCKPPGVNGGALMEKLHKYIAALVLATFLATASHAQEVVCGNRDEFAKALQKKHGEEVRAMGITSTGALVEFYASISGTWTVLFTTPSGQSCIAAEGTDFEILPPEAPPSI